MQFFIAGGSHPAARRSCVYLQNKNLGAELLVLLLFLPSRRRDISLRSFLFAVDFQQSPKAISAMLLAHYREKNGPISAAIKRRAGVIAFQFCARARVYFRRRHSNRQNSR
jgi:hypothetical protein